METQNNPADRKRTGKGGQTLTPGLVIAVIISSFILAFLGVRCWALLVVVLAVFNYIRKKENEKKDDSLEQEDIPEAKECELCGIKTENLVSVWLPREDRNALVCEECFRANGFRRADKQGEPVQEETAEAEPAKVAERLISETDAERESRLAALAGKKKEGVPLREDLFLEDIEDEKSIRVIYDMWESYGFGSDYPGIETGLAQLKQTGVSSARAGRLKEELRVLLHGEDA